MRDTAGHYQAIGDQVNMAPKLEPDPWKEDMFGCKLQGSHKDSSMKTVLK